MMKLWQVHNLMIMIVSLKPLPKITLMISSLDAYILNKFEITNYVMNHKT